MSIYYGFSLSFLFLNLDMSHYAPIFAVIDVLPIVLLHIETLLSSLKFCSKEGICHQFFQDVG